MAMKIGEKIKFLRKAKGISQETLAKDLGVTFQAVSKWETNTTAPDVSLIPSIASFFDVSIDELFDYNALENERIIDGICREAARCRFKDPLHAEMILLEGLRRFPSNESIMTVLVYVLWAIPGRDKELIETCIRLVACATNEGVRCDVLRILAEAYHRTGEYEKIPPVLERIPEFYFTKMECLAKLTAGQTSLDAARFQMNLSGKSLLEMLEIMGMRYAESGDTDREDRCKRLYDSVVSAFINEDGKVFEIAGYEWIPGDNE